MLFLFGIFSNISTYSLIIKQYIFAKNHRVSFKIASNKILDPFVCIYIDISSPFSTYIASRHKYFIFFIDDCTIVTWIYLLQSKSDIIRVISRFYNMTPT